MENHGAKEQRVSDPGKCDRDTLMVQKNSVYQTQASVTVTLLWCKRTACIRPRQV